MATAPDLRPILETIAACASLEEASERISRLPPGTPLRGLFAAGLVATMVRAGSARDVSGQFRKADQYAALVAIADEDPPSAPKWHEYRAMARVLILIKQAASDEPMDMAAAFAEVAAAEKALAGNPAAQRICVGARAVLTRLQALTQGDDSLLASTESITSSLQGLPVSPETAARLEWLQELEKAIADGGVPTLPATAAPGDETQRVALLVMKAAAATSADPSPAGLPAIDAEETAALERAAGSAAFPPAFRARIRLALGSAAMHQGWNGFPDHLASAVRHFETALELISADNRDRGQYLASLGLARWRLAEVTTDVAMAAAARRPLEEAKALIGGPQSRLWGHVNSALAAIRQRLGETDAHLDALEELRHNAWRVLLQNDLTNARAAARQAAEAALDVARNCVARSDPAAAIRALDNGRSLMLFAATELGDVEPRLAAAGRADLAERWRRRADSGEHDPIPGGLRHEVLSVLSEGGRLLDPPSLPEIRSALRALDADALVYLVPAGAPDPGYAVIAPADGAPRYMALAGLHGAGEADVDRYLSALNLRDIEPPGEPSGEGRFTGSLDALCEWAWRAAVGPLLEHGVRDLPVPPGRPPRLVLVPMRELALIPWQAARRPDGRYAVADAAFSMASSARMLCRSALLPPVKPTRAALVVGDPDTAGRGRPLAAARAEAYAVHQSFYPMGRYVGTRPNGTAAPGGRGTAAEVRAWLGADGAGEGAILHLACHGVIETERDAATTYLLLADGERIAADEVVPLLAGSADRGLALTVLAACRTGKSAFEYDEAYSLGSAFLAGGVRSVLSTQWAVPDEATSVLMFMFHHYFIADRLPAWEALRQAQLWMLAPDRTPPTGMPGPLRRRIDDPDTDLARVEAWAGFVHLGQ